MGSEMCIRDSFKPTPGASRAYGINYSASENSFVAVGRSDLVGCDLVCPRSSMTVVKVDAVTRQPDPDFGVGGVALVPLNVCPHGSAPPESHPSTPWVRCRLDKPAMTARIKFRRAMSRRPGLTGKVRLAGLPPEPHFVCQSVKVKLPGRIRLNRGARKPIVASANPAEGGRTSVALKGRTLTVAFAPEGYWDEYEGFVGPDNGPMEFSFRFRAGVIKPIGRRLRKKSLSFVVKGTNSPSANYVEGSSRFYASGSSTRTVRVRPVSGRVPRAGR